MERTVEEILNETSQFDSQYAINVWMQNLTVPDLISQLSKYSLSIDGKIEELTDRLERFIAMQRGYDEVPWDLSDQNFNFTCEFSQRLQKVISERARTPNELRRIHNTSQANAPQQSCDATISPTLVGNSHMQRQEASLTDFEAEPIVPSVRNTEEPMQGLDARQLRDETRDVSDEIK